MSLDQEAITQQLALLAAHRRTLAHLLQQAAQFGGEVFAPPQTANGIAEARQQLRRIKAVLRKNGVQVDDDPNDKAPRRRKSAQPPLAGDVVSGDKVTGDKRSITTEGGDYAEGNIDKRQGVFISGGIIYGPVVGVNQGSVTANYTVQQRPNPALHQLRAPVSDFVGREREIDQLVQALSRAASGGAAAAISGVRGMGGIGKTELARVVAHRLKETFPDAQILIELRGASSSPLTPEQALQTVIRAFEREAKLPDDLSQLKAIYSSVLAGKRVLILADDAKDAGQVRPLLPPGGCALLITSRYRFSVAGMAALDLGTLRSEEAEKLLVEICPRIGTYAGALARLCGYLPLALTVAARTLEANDTRAVARYLEQLATERLKHLTDPDAPDDPQASVEASLRLSYDALELAAQRAMGQLSVFPTSFDVAAALAVVAVEREVAEMLELLRRRSLLEWDANLQRFSLHELVRVFAAARLEDVAAVWLRYARHYAQVADSAGSLYHQGGEALMAGLALFDQERVHIDAGWDWARERAGDQDADALLLDYADATAYVGDLRYDKRRERIPQLEAQLAAAQRLKSRGAEGAALGNLGLTYAELGDARQAITFFEQALDIDYDIGDLRGVSNAMVGVGDACVDLGDARQAITLYEQALVNYRLIGDQHGEGVALGHLGNAYVVLGDARQAISFYKQALVIDRELGNRLGEGSALGNLASAYYALGDARRAISFFEQCVAILRELGDRLEEGNALGNLGLAYAELGDARKAISFHEQDLEIAR